MTKLTIKQYEGLKELLYGSYLNINSRTLASLKRRGLTDGYKLTVAGCDVLELPKVEVSEKAQETRKVQDEIMALVDHAGWSYSMRVSSDMPPDITVYSLMTVVYPDYLSVLRGVLFTLKERVRVRD